MDPGSTQAFFVPLGRGSLVHRLCLWHAPGELPARRVFVHVHAFAEEMNKSRRMAAWQSRALAHSGDATLQFDLLGCGDSAGDFGDATWQDWIDDIAAAAVWALRQHEQAWPSARQPELWLWGHRAGGLLACAAAALLAQPCHLLLWQPTPLGTTVLKQFLRLETAASLLGKPAQPQSPSARELLARGETAEVAGYRLNAAMASGLASARLSPPSGVVRTEWIDLAARPASEPSPAVKQSLADWREAGNTVRHQQIVGPAFWQATEMEDAPSLIRATLAAVHDSGASADCGEDRVAHARELA